MISMSLLLYRCCCLSVVLFSIAKKENGLFLVQFVKPFPLLLLLLLLLGFFIFSLSLNGDDVNLNSSKRRYEAVVFVLSISDYTSIEEREEKKRKHAFFFFREEKKRRRSRMFVGYMKETFEQYLREWEKLELGHKCL